MPAFSTIALFCTVLGLTLAGAPAGYAHELETVKLVFQRAIPNIPGKNLVALVVNYPPGGKPASPSCEVRLHLRACAYGRHSKRCGHRARESVPSGRELPRRTWSASPGERKRQRDPTCESSGGLHRRCRGPATHHTRLEFRHTIVPCRARGAPTLVV